ncbi:MAG: hypothetical protein FWG30_11305 [Eubacteriaceae bacterium]|nr:hypothetical protein [Eubacteriaceae bacterium]
MAFSLSPRENYLNALNHKPTEYTPGTGADSYPLGRGLPIERGPGGSGIDGFGVNWVAPWSAIGAALPEPGKFMLTDIRDWKKVITMPDLSVYDWEGNAAADLNNVDRNSKVFEVSSSNSIFERIATFMGFEETLVSFAEEPEASFELLSALADWKIEVMKYFAKHYQPDTFIFYDDVATEHKLFMSPDTYRQLIKPNHTRMCQAARELGIIPIQHTCGKADSLVEDMIEEGCAAWHAVQATNEIEGIIESHGDEFTIIGGYNSNGLPGQQTATEEMIREEVNRCIRAYGKYNKGYIFSGGIVNPVDSSDPLNMGVNNSYILDEFLKIRKMQQEGIWEAASTL